MAAYNGIQVAAAAGAARLTMTDAARPRPSVPGRETHLNWRSDQTRNKFTIPNNKLVLFGILVNLSL